jgi:hypothetical protein
MEMIGDKIPKLGSILLCSAAIPAPIVIHSMVDHKRSWDLKSSLKTTFKSFYFLYVPVSLSAQTSAKLAQEKASAYWHLMAQPFPLLQRDVG